MAGRGDIASASSNSCDEHVLSCQADGDSPAVQKNGKVSSPRSVASSSKCILAEGNAPSAPYPGTKQKSKSSTSFLPPLMSMLSLSFDSEDEGDDHDQFDSTSSTSSTEHLGNSDTGMLRSILRSSFYKACTLGSAGCSNPGANSMHKSVSFSKKLNEVESISTIDERIKAKQRSHSMSNLRSQHKTKSKTKKTNTIRSNTIGHFTSSLTCVSNLTCDSFRYYSSAVDDHAVPMMSVYNIDDEEEDWA